MLNPSITYQTQPAVDNQTLNALFAAAWPDHTDRDFEKQLQHSLAYVCAYQHEAVIGFVNLAWDGGSHAFLLDTTVHPHYQRHGIGRALVGQAIAAARHQNISWLHVDYEPHLHDFYTACGFRPTLAGLINLQVGGTP